MEMICTTDTLRIITLMNTAQIIGMLAIMGIVTTISMLSISIMMAAMMIIRTRPMPLVICTLAKALRVIMYRV